MATFKSTVGVRRSSGTFAGTASTEARASMRGIQRSINDIFKSLENATPEALLEAMQPTFEKALYYTPVDTGDLKSSGYMQTKKQGKNIELEIGFGKGGQPPYAAHVHERTDIPHAAPTRAKFLQSAIEEDAQDIPNRLAAALKKRMKRKR